jgi:beta-lactamase regulating signal transducer with metallopeptidase domain
MAILRFVYDFCFLSQRSVIDAAPLPQHGILTIGINLKEKALKVIHTTLTLNNITFSSGDIASSLLGSKLTMLIGGIMLLTGTVMLFVRILKFRSYYREMADSLSDAKIPGFQGIRISDRIKTPMVFGIIKPVIVLPTSLMCSCTADELNAVISHEKAHIRRLDHILFPMLSAMKSFFVFVPMLGIAIRKLEESAEQICDKKAAQTINSKSAVASALLKIAEFQVESGLFRTRALSAGSAPGFISERKTVEKRLASLFQKEKPGKGIGRYVGILLAAAFYVISFLFIFGNNTF